ncbi:MAG: quinol:cytochrome C oxidoreductase, partial [Planctomycetota bacterium]
AVYFGIWILYARFYFRNSVQQDESGDVELTKKMERRSPLAMILYGITVTFASFDLLMSLDPHWYSTIFGVYYFSGAVVGFFALLVLMIFFAQKAGHLRDPITTEHRHDVGKQLFGYVVFWAYIAFSQYMLIWYANIPEETEWFLLRQTGGWGTVSLVLLFGHFLLPFLALLPREMKRRPAALAAVAAWMLVMHWIDVFYLTAPEKGSGLVPFGVVDVACVLGLSGLFAASVAFALRKVSLVPERDPRLPESLAFENM